MKKRAMDGAPLKRHRKLEPPIFRPATGQMYRASFPHGWGDGDAFAAALSGGPNFYFREVELVSRPWWRGGDVWQDTGEIWKPRSGEFEVAE